MMNFNGRAPFSGFSEHIWVNPASLGALASYEFSAPGKGRWFRLLPKLSGRGRFQAISTNRPISFCILTLPNGWRPATLAAAMSIGFVLANGKGDWLGSANPEL